MSTLSRIADKTKTVKRVKRTISGKDYWVHYVDGTTFREGGFSLFGYVYEGKIYVRTQLPRKVERYILIHEAYHVRDAKTWLGKVGKEIRANAYAGWRDPIGFLATLLHSLNRHRTRTYWRLYVSHR
jgi:hypothetical protein